jgi:hypothetical protein
MSTGLNGGKRSRTPHEIALASRCMWWLIGSFVVDQCWLSNLQARSPTVPSISEGLTVALRMHTGRSIVGSMVGPVFYVSPFDAAIHYCLGWSFVAAFVTAIYIVLRHHLPGRS